MPQDNNSELAKNLSVYFPMRNEPNYALGNALSCNLGTAALRGFWGADCDESRYLIDLSGHGRSLHPYSGTPTPGKYGLCTYMDYVRANTHYYSRVTEPGLSTFQYLSLWTWVKFHAQSTGNETWLISKWYETTDQRSFALYKTAGNVLTFALSGDGAAAVTVGDAAASYIVDTWLFIGGTLFPNTSLNLYIGNGKTGAWSSYTQAAGVPNAPFDSSEPLDIGRGNRDNYFDGYLTYFGLADITDPEVSMFDKFHAARPLFMW